MARGLVGVVVMTQLAIAAYACPALSAATAANMPEPGTAPTLEMLAGHLRGLGLAAQKWPERVELVDELPRTPMGKVRKADLRIRFATT